MSKKKAKVGESNKPLDAYLSDGSGAVTPKTVRAPDLLWRRVRDLALIKGCSVNQLLVATMTKVCDEQGIA